MAHVGLIRPCRTLWRILILLSIVNLHASASPVVSTALAKTPVLLHQFPNGSWVENIQTLASGHILLTLLDKASLILLDPAAPDGPVVAYHARQHTALLGIAQPEPGSLAVVYGNLSTPQHVSTPRSYGVALFSVSVQGAVTHKADIPVPDAHMLDGLTALPRSSRYVLAADSDLGLVWRVDLVTGAAERALTSSVLGPRPNTTTVSVNGIHAQDDYLYFTNSNTASFGRVHITAEGLPVSQATDQGDVLTQDFNGTTYDDFALGAPGSGIFYLCSTNGNSINKFNVRTGRQTTLAGGPGDNTFDHPVAAMLGKSAAYKKILFVTTAGIIPGVGGVGGGQVFAVQTD